MVELISAKWAWQGTSEGQPLKVREVRPAPFGWDGEPSVRRTLTRNIGSRELVQTQWLENKYWDPRESTRGPPLFLSEGMTNLSVRRTLTRNFWSRELVIRLGSKKRTARNEIECNSPNWKWSTWNCQREILWAIYCNQPRQDHGHYKKATAIATSSKCWEEWCLFVNYVKSCIIVCKMNLYI